jgi:hypothetical protein
MRASSTFFHEPEGAQAPCDAPLLLGARGAAVDAAVRTDPRFESATNDDVYDLTSTPESNTPILRMVDRHPSVDTLTSQL